MKIYNGNGVELNCSPSCFLYSVVVAVGLFSIIISLIKFALHIVYCWYFHLHLHLVLSQIPNERLYGIFKLIKKVQVL